MAARKKPVPKRRKAPARVSAPLLNIGVSGESVQSVREAVMSILSAPHADEETKRTALQALDKLCSVNHATLNGCSFMGGG